ncbi:MAG: UvrD-helicase domain-containing protein [Bacteroidota bacterium]
MKLTEEQKEVIAAEGNAKVNAVAGSGKTTTLIHFAKARPGNRILYLAFNRSVRQEAQRKFAEEGLGNVDVQTAHSLAYQYVMRKYRYELVSDYKAHELAEILNLNARGIGKQNLYGLISHIKRLAQLFCNQQTRKVRELNYQATLKDDSSRQFVEKYYDRILRGARVLLAKMDKGQIPITHDFYLKKFQLNTPKLHYDYILFDEGQDASPVMLDVFLQQSAHKVIVGDRHQQIYGWRSAINALHQVDFPTLFLSNSFRFDQDLAELAAAYISWKDYLKRDASIRIQGMGTCKSKKTQATLARTNLSLLRKAILAVEGGKLKRLYFEGNLNSYTYAQEGASLYDVLNLYKGKKRRIRDKLIASMSSFEDLQSYVEATEDRELGMMMEIVQEFKGEIPKLLNKLKEAHLPNEEKHRAEMIFSTVHRCKGMEYDQVYLEEDFLGEEDIWDSSKDPQLNTQDRNRLEEEINLLYVACTRTKNILHLPEYLLPKDWEESESGKRIQTLDPLPSPSSQKSSSPTSSRKKFSPQKDNTSKTNAYKRWSYQEENQLKEWYEAGETVTEIAKKLKRKPGAVYARIKKMRLFE